MHRELSFRKKILSGEFALMSRKELYWLTLLLAAIATVVLWFIFAIVEPPPPKHIKMLTGSSSGAYYGYGQKYAAELKRHGITLEVIQSAGSVENLAKMRNADSNYSVALIQSGIATPATADNDTLESLSSVAYEPLWVFYRPKDAKERITSLANFKSKRIAVGPEGSGTRQVALRMLATVDILASNSSYSELTGVDAISAVLEGKIDAAILVASSDAASVQKALLSGLRPVNFERADAYVRLNPWLSKIVLPRGVVRMAQDLPDEDLVLVAATANLVVKTDLHPAISFLLMDIASELHRAPSMLNGLKEFPSEKSLDFAQSAESKRFFKTGRPFLQRYLPFWLANLIERLLVTLVPVLAVLIPALQIVPKLFTWFGKSGLLKLYDRARLIELNCEDTEQARAQAREEIVQIEKTLQRLPPNSDLFVEVYNLRAHLDLVKDHLR
jgi:TRAP transporter TAXI family solute receptor